MIPERALKKAVGFLVPEISVIFFIFSYSKKVISKKLTLRNILVNALYFKEIIVPTIWKANPIVKFFQRIFMIQAMKHPCKYFYIIIKCEAEKGREM